MPRCRSHHPECDCPIFNAFRRGLPCRIDDEVLWRADGSSFPAEYSSHPVVESERRSVRVGLTARPSAWSGVRPATCVSRADNPPAPGW